jgi:hypothetical protein
MEIPGVAALSSYATLISISCASAGNCAAAGWYQGPSSDLLPFVANEVNGSWRKAIEVPGIADLNFGAADLNSVSCGSAGNCVAGGYYTDRIDDEQAFVTDEVNGTWQKAIEVPGTAVLNELWAMVSSVSCASAGNCTLGGYYTGYLQAKEAFVADEVNGSWSGAIEVPGTAAVNTDGDATVSSVSCGSAGNCTAVGYYTGAQAREPFAVEEVKNSWRNAVEVPGIAALDDIWSVSCASAGNCAAGGDYLDSSDQDQAFVADEVNGSWQDAIEVPGTAALNTAGNAGANSVSCASAGNCAVGGQYTSGSSLNYSQAFVADEVNGSWQDAVGVPGPSADDDTGSLVLAVSCPSAGNCTAGGSSDGLQAFVSDEAPGS